MINIKRNEYRHSLYSPYYRIWGRVLDKRHFLEWKRQGGGYYNPDRIEAGLKNKHMTERPKPKPLTLVFVNIQRQEKPKTGTLLDYMERV